MIRRITNLEPACMMRRTLREKLILFLHTANCPDYHSLGTNTAQVVPILGDKMLEIKIKNFRKLQVTPCPDNLFSLPTGHASPIVA